MFSFLIYSNGKVSNSLWKGTIYFGWFAMNVKFDFEHKNS
jgi:hypothetical protein